ncbi:hypothetical protein HY967_04575 [Candidatus Jorgensenbacteria bacterium]|nr:hypothetical protein [Candidatus Jorgensenbacteria bacterium]
MKFNVPKSQYNLISIVRGVGYRPLGYTQGGELNCVRPLGADYPRFHLYIREGSESFMFNLHLDQKRPSYQGSTAHSGDYNSDIIKSEASRIRGIIGI